MITKQKIGPQLGKEFPPGFDSLRHGLSMPVSVSEQVGGVADGNRKRALRCVRRLQFDDFNSGRREGLPAAGAAWHHCSYAMSATPKFGCQSSDRNEMAKAGANLPREDDMKPARQL